jgi:hypothetical protein
MGLLDDAIREHLELKRLRGADPELVSREESEALEPTRGGEPADTGDDIAASDDLAGEDAPPAADGPGQAEGFSNVGQETAELDMRMVLDDESDRLVPAMPPSSGPPQEQGTTDDSLEWEMPGDGSAHGSGEQAEDDLPSGESGDEPVEDVLEETPDFLRDTPEQERLWFEQRPPRDFDFDK